MLQKNSMKWFGLIILLIASIGLEGCSFLSSSSRKKPVKVTRVDKPSATRSSTWDRNNAQVRKYVKFYSAKSNRTVELALKRAQPYLPYIRKELKKRKLPMELAYLPMLESSFNPRAKSPTGALGMWQFTEATAGDYNLKVGWFSDDRLNWKKSTKAAATYLDRLGKKFKNWELALAAYNGGPGYIERSMKKQGTRNFWSLKIREEPKTYVPKFIAMIQVAKKKYPKLYKS